MIGSSPYQAVRKFSYFAGFYEILCGSSSISYASAPARLQ